MSASMFATPLPGSSAQDVVACSNTDFINKPFWHNSTHTSTHTLCPTLEAAAADSRIHSSENAESLGGIRVCRWNTKRVALEGIDQECIINTFLSRSGSESQMNTASFEDEGGDSNYMGLRPRLNQQSVSSSRQHLVRRFQRTFLQNSKTLDRNPGNSFVTALLSGAPEGAYNTRWSVHPRKPQMVPAQGLGPEAQSNASRFA